MLALLLAHLLACHRPPPPPAAASFFPETRNGSFEEVDAEGRPVGWTLIPHDATAWARDPDAAPVGATSLRLDAEIHACSPWQALTGPLRVRGKVKLGEGAIGMVSLRLRDARGSRTFPVLARWTGPMAWRDFDLTWNEPTRAREYAVCVGRPGTAGAAWFDGVEAGGLVFGEERAAPVELPAELRVEAEGLTCAAWRPSPVAVRVRGHLQGEGLAPGEKDWHGTGVFLRARRAEGAPQSLVPLALAEEGDAPFERGYRLPPGRAEYRLCVGRTGGAGTAVVTGLQLVEIG